ncbi:amidohydrolase family protein [Telmatocola sphagniphila]|uniref:Amidohydrolase family protein n=1 Tax=Telmatocola sphagniphila TaxID=1123043 RepID=A0A8E6B6T0_9BACT|nr:amidohydrolase family protein [Telmatocola sphagniphila]QVL32952.1 amidohydrolase family protein [Telmatocola sphagniphila]
MKQFINARLVLPDRVLSEGTLRFNDDKIDALGSKSDLSFNPSIETIDLEGKYLFPGFVEAHVHGGLGADFMDLTPEAFRTVCRCHARHGTTTMTPTSTVGSPEQILEFLKLTRQIMNEPQTGSRVVGAHLYGPYFALEAVGCHPKNVRAPLPSDYIPVLEYTDAIRTATVAPELPSAEVFTRECLQRGIRMNAGHSFATFEQMEEAVRWGIRHVDHLFCAMSDRGKLRALQNFPNRGGVMEATLYFDELTTEVIADGKHLSDALLRLAYKIKGPNRLALVTDSNRAVDMPDGEYLFGPPDAQIRTLKKEGVGLTLDGKNLASSVVGLDHCFRTMLTATQAPLHDVARCVTLTPARILGLEEECGSLIAGKRADFVVMDDAMQVQDVWIGGKKIDAGISRV